MEMRNVIFSEGCEDGWAETPCPVSLKEREKGLHSSRS